jgi:hypothetical protein
MTDLITEDIYKQAKAITGTKEDERLDQLIPSISQLVKTYCGNSFVDYVNTPYTETFSIYYGAQQIIQLGEIPVIEIVEVYERYNTNERYSLVEPTNFELDPRTDSIIKTFGFWPEGINSVRVAYKAGYQDTPEDLKLALIDLVAYYLKDEYKLQRTLKSGSMKNAGSSTLDSNIGFPDHIKRVLDMYRQIT